MKRIGLFLVLGLLFMTSCTRQRGSTTACFNFSRTPAKVNDTLYLLNCSVNYDKFKWHIPAYAYYDSLNRHLKFVPTSAGSLQIDLWVAVDDTSKTNKISQVVTVQ